MTIRITLVLLLGLLAAGLLFFSCAKQDSDKAPATALRIPSWPPDTMAITLVGSGRLAIIASWTRDGMEPGARRQNIYEIIGIAVPPDTGRVAMRMTMAADTTVEMLKHIIERPRTGASAAALVLKSWPPDTTGK